MKVFELIHGGLYLIHDASDIVVRYDITSNSFRSEWYEYPLALFHDDVCSTDGDRYIFVKPIPLSEEILKENGWNCEEGWFENKDVNFLIAKVVNKYKLCPVYHMKSFATILYVHELQHALRLCGLNDLADSFKV